MTLITYLSRVHFADGVLEDALYSELELNRYTRPFTICEVRLNNSEFAERLNSGIPIRSKAKHFAIEAGISQQDLVEDICRQFFRHKSDVLVAFGSSKAILIAGKCHEALSKKANPAIGKGNSGKMTASDFFAIPGVDGLPNMSPPRNISAKLASPYIKKQAQPSVIICDPTLTLGEPPEQTASAAVNTISRCIEAYLSKAYNPPADGIAFDGLARTVRNLPDVLKQDSLSKRRELMAAGLNGTLAQQKGAGMAQALTDALTYSSKSELDQGALKGILLPGVLNLVNEQNACSRRDQIRIALKIPNQESLQKGLLAFLSSLPLPSTLHELGVSQSNIMFAAKELTANEEFPMPDEATLLSLMGSVYGAA